MQAGVLPFFFPPQGQRGEAGSIKAFVYFIYLCDTEFSVQSLIINRIK